MPFPSDEQAAVISHRGRPLVVVAGPGTGKTRTLVERMLRLLEEDQSREVSFITFARTSRRDTSDRLVSAFGDAILDQPQSLFPRTSTLHAYAKSLVHRYAGAIGRSSDFSVMIEEKREKSIVLEDALHDLQIDTDIPRLSQDLSCLRSTGNWPRDAQLAERSRDIVSEHYERLLALYRTLDMEGMVTCACQVLASAAASLPPIFLQVDEYQDLNPVDQRLVRLAASHHNSQVVVVGDDAQSIYGFRHANYAGLRELWVSEEWEHTSFPDSQRLPAHILNAALDLIAGEGYLGSQISRKPDNGRRIRVMQCTQSNLQVPALAQQLQAVIAARSEAPVPLRYKDFLILCPTAALVDNVVSELSERHEIPAHKPTASSIPDDVWALLLLLRILHNRDPLALRQLLPVLGFSLEEIQALRQLALSQGASFYDVCLNRDDPRIGAFSHQIDTLRSAAQDLATFQQALAAVEGVPPQDRFFAIVSPLLQTHSDRMPSFGRLIQLVYQSLGIVDPGEQVALDDRVLVATMHSAKGLEAEHVYCLWMNSRFMPMPNRDPSEQRRVLYVAMTRAKQDLTLLFHEEFDQSRRRRLYEEAMSPYLQCIRGHLDVQRVRAEHLHRMGVRPAVISVRWQEAES